MMLQSQTNPRTEPTITMDRSLHFRIKAVSEVVVSGYSELISLPAPNTVTREARVSLQHQGKAESTVTNLETRRNSFKLQKY